MRGNEFMELAAFVAVAEEASFRRAATRLALKPSTVSHAVRALEDRTGVRLLARTTRSVAPTDAGRALLDRVGPAIAALDGAAAQIADERAEPSGSLRISSPQGAAANLLAPMLARFVAAYPKVTLEIAVDDGFVDIVADGFDAGIRLGESVAAGMTSVAISAPIRAAVVAAPSYFTTAGYPTAPRDLMRHRCINRRYARGRDVHRWMFARNGETIEIACPGPLVLDREPMMRRAALDGAGVAFLAETDVADDIAAGRLERVLEEWCPPTFVYRLYHPSRSLPSAALRAFMDALRPSA